MSDAFKRHVKITRINVIIVIIKITCCMFEQAWCAEGPSDHVRSLAGHLLRRLSDSCETGTCVMTHLEVSRTVFRLVQ